MALSLQDLAAKMDWVIVGGAKSHLLSADKITVRYFKLPAERKLPESIVKRSLIRIGKGVLEKLGWAYGDRIAVYYHPDDMMSYMLIKSDTSVGYKLIKESNSLTGAIQIRWDRDFIIKKEIPAQDVAYEINNNRLIFRTSI